MSRVVDLTKKISGESIFDAQISALQYVRDNISEDFEGVVNYITRCHGKVIICGVGKSGLIGKKIAATLTSTGTPSVFLHASEALHGDLGIVEECDIVLIVTNSGETAEIIALLPSLQLSGAVVVAITGNPTSTVAKFAHFHLSISVLDEACPLSLAPMSSTTATLVMGDALAACIMTAKKFTKEDFAKFHPGGALGRRLLSKVKDEMLLDERGALDPSSDFSTIINHMMTGILGVAVIEHDSGFGIVTDGDIRRAIETHGERTFGKCAQDIMTHNPIIIDYDEMVQKAFQVMKNNKVHSLIVTKNGQYIGVFKR